MKLYPNLSNLPTLPLHTGTFPYSSKLWEDRHDLVIGKCKTNPADENETECYKVWSDTLCDNALQNTRANTVVLLSVGAGVLELQTLMKLQKEKSHFISQVWLIDPGLDKPTGDQVASHFKARLGEFVKVTYFSGPNAYTDAMETLEQTFEKFHDFGIAAIGALNVSFGMLSPDNLSQYEEVQYFTALVKETNTNDCKTRIVTAYYNATEKYVVRNELLDEFNSREKRIVEFYEPSLDEVVMVYH
tara:strand:- start:67 stop:801 length:735 start_codon:yes stop_codon:yes gene_type:complete